MNEVIIGVLLNEIRLDEVQEFIGKAHIHLENFFDLTFIHLSSVNNFSFFHILIFYFQ
jgi:hypothetical protein